MTRWETATLFPVMCCRDRLTSILMIRQRWCDQRQLRLLLTKKERLFDEVRV
eukprot:JZ550793.1.p3 GENE.JZ550793.1~~JZ550793.1.p3  ORF type:complete len:52 (+),score=0.76 JZ550793.1:269-424(+)